MIAPRLSVRHRDVEYAIEQLGEAWVIDVAGGKYFLTAGDDPTLQARAFLGKLPRNSTWPRIPALIASPHHPLLLDVDGAIVRAWPTLLSRDDPPKTYEHPWHGHRVIATGEPAWMFATRGRQASIGGAAEGEQSVAELEALARLWVRMGEHR